MTYSVVKWKSLSNLCDFNPKEMPIQWDAWMRHTRQHPPTIEVCDDHALIFSFSHYLTRIGTVKGSRTATHSAAQCTSPRDP